MPMLFVVVLIDLIGLGIIIPILPFLAPTLGASNLDIALIISIYSLCGGLASPYWGKLSDRIGRKPVILICLAGASASYVLLALAETLAALYLSRAIAGVMAGNFGVASAMIADLSKPENRAKAMGMIGAAFGLGLVIGPFLGGILAGDDGNYFRTGVFAAGLSALAFLAGVVFLKESLTPQLRAEQTTQRQTFGDGGSMLRMLRDSGNTLLTLQYFLASGCHTVVSYLFPLWVGAMLGWGAKEVGMVFGLLGLTMAALQAGAIGALVRLMGELRLLLISAFIMMLGFVLAATAQGQVQIVLAFFATIAGATLCTPVLNTLLANRTPMHLRGRMMGTASSSSAYGRVFGPMLGGVMLAGFGFEIAWLSGLLVAGLIVAWALSQMRRPAEPTAPQHTTTTMTDEGAPAHGT